MGEAFTAQITPLLITYNETANIERVLAKLQWARRIVVVDSGSTDGTLDILAADPKVSVVHRAFDDFATQCQFGLAQIGTEWALSMDADYVLTDALIAEIGALEPDAQVAGYEAGFRYCVWGRPLRGTLYPPRTVLYRVARARYRNEGHGPRVGIEGAVRQLSAPILHDDRKPLSRWLGSQQKYAAIEAEHLLAARPGELRGRDRMRLMAWPAPFVVFAYTLFAKGCLFDGWPGWFYALQRLLAEVMLALELIDRRQGGAMKIKGRTER
jgi:glycosyltransferase involved in cell wall biosynthesis